MKMLWDDEALYVGAWLEEPQVVATLTEKNSVIFHDNDFEVFINPGATQSHPSFRVSQHDKGSRIRCATRPLAQTARITSTTSLK